MPVGDPESQRVLIQQYYQLYQIIIQYTTCLYTDYSYQPELWLSLAHMHKAALSMDDDMVCYFY